MKSGARETLILAFLTAIASYSQPAFPHRTLIRQAQLLSKNTGWALIGDHLMMSNDLGATWREVTPPGPRVIEDVFFLNDYQGWVVTATDSAGSPSLSIAQTQDGGRSWATRAFTGEPAVFFQGIYSGEASLTFLDSSHGWLLLVRTSSSNFSLGDLFSTGDGGKTWQRLPDPPISTSIRFISTTTGWLAGGPGGFDLYVTHDGGTTWKKQQVLPPGGSAAEDAFYDLPYFPGNQLRNGVLPVAFADGQTLVLYATSDEGETWQSASVETDIPTSGAAIAPMALRFCELSAIKE